MAIMINKIFGNLQGTLTNFVIRNRNGKLVVYSKPLNQKISQSRASIKARNNFALAVALAKQIISNENLHKIWDISKIAATNTYQKIIKTNAKLINESKLTTKNLIVPDGIDFEAIQIKLSNKILGIKVKNDSLKEKLDDLNYLYALIFLFNDKRESTTKLSKDDYFLNLYEFKIVDNNSNDEFSFSINFNKISNLQFNKCLIITSFLGKKNEKQCWTRSFAKIFDL